MLPNTITLCTKNMTFVYRASLGGSTDAMKSQPHSRSTSGQKISRRWPLHGYSAHTTRICYSLLHQNATQLIHLISKHFGCRGGGVDSEEPLKVVCWHPANSTAVLSGRHQPPVISTAVQHLKGGGRGGGGGGGEGVTNVWGAMNECWGSCS